MRHLKHHFQLGVKQAHRKSLVANLASQLFLHGKIKTTLIKAKALRPFAEKIITLAKCAAKTEKTEDKLHYRRLAITRLRNETAVKKLFDETVQQFLNRNGGYTRIYKLMFRIGDGAPMALIQLVEEPVEKRRLRKPKGEKVAKAKGKKATTKAGSSIETGSNESSEQSSETMQPELGATEVSNSEPKPE